VSRRSKLIEKIRARPVEAEYRDVFRLLEDFGWIWSRTVGSHNYFVKSGQLPMSIPTAHGRKVKRAYLEMICIRLGLDDIDLDDLED
jgi:predicted RNA binding protein YcfA (HicA-like mRNA interferase family)